MRWRNNGQCREYSDGLVNDQRQFHLRPAAQWFSCYSCDYTCRSDQLYSADVNKLFNFLSKRTDNAVLRGEFFREYFSAGNGNTDRKNFFLRRYCSDLVFYYSEPYDQPEPAFVFSLSGWQS